MTTPRPIPVPPSWRDAAHHLRLAAQNEAAARQLAAMQYGDGARRELTLAVFHAIRAAARLGRASALLARAAAMDEHQRERAMETLREVRAAAVESDR